jgi:predicted phosphodiesterase
MASKEMRGSKKSVLGEKVKAYCQEYKGTSTSALTRIICKKHKNLVDSAEQVRYMVRYYRSSTGNKNRMIINRSNPDVPKHVPVDYDKLYPVPESLNVPRQRWQLPKSIKKVLLIGDLHSPFHDKRAIQVTYHHAKKEKVDAVFINGDLIDFHVLSFHEKDPDRRIPLSEELEITREILTNMRKVFDGIPIYYIPGNHERRMERYLANKAADLLGVEEFRLDVLLRLGEIGIEYIPYRSKTYFGKLLVDHGDRMVGTGGVNPARNARLRYKRSVVVNHFHKLTVDSGRIYDGGVLTCWSNGCLCELEPGYMEINEHVHGFCYVDMIDDKGGFSVTQKQIINGKIY